MVAVPNYRNYQRSRLLEKTYQDMVADIRLAQEYAISGKKPQEAASPCQTGQLQGYYVDRSSSTQYRIRVKCGGTYYIIKTAKVTGVSISEFNQFGFKVLGEGTDIPYDSFITITLTQANTSSYKYIYIYPDGRIF